LFFCMMMSLFCCICYHCCSTRYTISNSNSINCFHCFRCHILLINTDYSESFFCFTDFLISAAVSEFKGPEIFGVVRLAQVNMELARIEANFSGLSPGKHSWSINEFGDLTRGAASTGKVFNLLNGEKTKEVCFFLYLLDNLCFTVKICF
jgi:hypothetical protein